MSNLCTFEEQKDTEQFAICIVLCVNFNKIQLLLLKHFSALRIAFLNHKTMIKHTQNKYKDKKQRHGSTVETQRRDALHSLLMSIHLVIASLLHLNFIA